MGGACRGGGGAGGWALKRSVQICGDDLCLILWLGQWMK